MTYLGRKKNILKLLSVRFKLALITVGSGPQKYLKKAFVDKHRETEYWAKMKMKFAKMTKNHMF